MQVGVEAHLDPRRKVEEVEVHSQGVVGEVEALHLEEEVEVECKHGQAEEEVEEDSHQEEEGVAGVEEEAVHPLVEVVEVVLRVQLDLLQSANTR